MLLGISAEHLSEYSRAVKLVGERYGMELHWDKFQLLQAPLFMPSFKIQGASGQDIKAKDRMSHLGISLRTDGTMESELGKKLEVAWSDFMRLSQF